MLIILLIILLLRGENWWALNPYLHSEDINDGSLAG